MDIKHFKTPSYILKAVHTYNKKNHDLINQKARAKYTQKKHELQKLKEQNIIQPSKYSLMPPDAKEAYKAKQRAYYHARKQKLTQQTSLTPANEQK